VQDYSAPTAAAPIDKRQQVSVWAEVSALVALSIPVVAGLAGGTAMSAVDSWMLGSLGEIPLAAASLTQSVLVIFYAGLYGFVGAVGLLAGRAYGARDPGRGSSILRHGLVLGLNSGIYGAVAMAAVLLILPYTGQPSEVLAALPEYWIVMSAMLIPFTLAMVIKLFLDSIGRAWTAAALNLLPVAFSIPLNWLLVYGHFGSGIANVAAFAAALVVMLLFLCLAPSMAPYRGGLGIRSSGFRDLTREGVPMGVQYFAEAGAVAVAGILIGWLGATALAANQIVFSVAVLIYMAPLGMSAAVSIRIAQALGEGDLHRVRTIGLSGIGVVSLWMLAFTALMVLWGESMARAFVDDPAVVATATLMFVTVGVMQVFDGLQSVSLGALRGLLDNRWPTRVSLIAYWLIALPLSLLFGFVLGYGAPGVWAGFGVGLAIAGVLLLSRFIARTGRLTH
jgi:MATE family multidrug resistance protein